MTRPAEASRHYSAPLHGLRGVAVLYVVASHLGNVGLFLLPIRHDAIGKVGVWIFFVLSAFLLTRNLRFELGSGAHPLHSTMKYFIHRFFRIYPLYALVLAGHVMLRDIGPMQAVSHLFLTQGWGELWAIPVEFRYYLVVPMVCITAQWMGDRNAMLLLIAGVIGACAVGIAQPASVFSNELDLLPKTAPFALGSMLAIALHRARWGASTAYVPSAPLVIVSAVALAASTLLYRGISTEGRDERVAPLLSVLIGVSVCGLMLAALRYPVAKRLLGSPALVFLGEVSFSIYLLHLFVIRLVRHFHAMPTAVQAWAALLLSIALAWASYQLIERPGILAGRALANRVGV